MTMSMQREKRLGRASAPGKLILIGEHAVVYGVPAIATALGDLRVAVAVYRVDCPGVHITMPQFPDNLDESHTYSCSTEALLDIFGEKNAQYSIDNIDEVLVPSTELTDKLKTLSDSKDPMVDQVMVPALFLTGAILFATLQEIQDAGKGLELCIEKPTLPIAAGLGSSAAVSVATTTALLSACTASRIREYQEELQLSAVPHAHFSGDPEGIVARPQHMFEELINTWALSAETLFHGSPSGLDNTVATYGGALLYRKGQSPAFTQIEGMPSLNVLVTNTKQPKSTSKLVQGVKELRDKKPELVDAYMRTIGSITELVEVFVRTELGSENALKSETEYKRIRSELESVLGPLLQSAHRILTALGVGHSALDRVCEESSKIGAWTKLTGAGGGGCALTLLPTDLETSRLNEMIASLSEESMECFQTCLGGFGALIDK